ncbi:YcnI family protein [Streptomyces gobiensis]|uniref:YcnI family copper-binding membrane protein n=1 Tax=Streptomyces gobiensis TaxID=2875706 RepID=UPI001E632081|nr:YcnI family protein [Streptomyces gobiensis]UGY92486.1 YcnI family protein [Streptomyces gobiensis]
MNTLSRSLTTIGGLTAAAVLTLTGPAFAHVSVDPGEVPQGGFATINFKVPNERDSASTSKLEITLPTDHPVASVMPEPVPGWDVKVEKAKLDKPLTMHGEEIDEAPSKITWSGGTIEPGTFQRFPVSIGRLPEDADQLVFKAIQTYDNDEVVRWIEAPKEGADEPDHPAPVLALTPASDDGHGSPDSQGSQSGEDAQNTANASEEKSSMDTTARILAAIGIVTGIGGIGYGVLAGRRRSAA